MNTKKAVYNVSNIERVSLKETLAKTFHDEAVEAVMKAVNLHEELLSIIRALDEQFKAGADKVYRDALAPHTDDLTLAQWIDQTLQKAEASE